MTADRPVTPGADISDEMVEAYAAVRRRSHAPTTAEAIRAGLAAVVPLIRARVAAEPGESVPIRCMRCGKPVSAPIPGDIVVRAWVECPECVARGPEQASAFLAAAPYREDAAEDWDWTIPTPSAAITPAIPSTFAAPVTVTLGGDFAEPDEDPADVQAAFDAGEKGVTRRPAVTVDPADLRTVLDQSSVHYHQRAAVWDDDNRPEIAGKPCVECAARERLRAALATALEQAGAPPVAAKEPESLEQLPPLETSPDWGGVPRVRYGGYRAIGDDTNG